MGFWDLSDGATAADTGSEYEIPGGNLEPIPAGSSVLAAIDEAKWDTNKDGDASFISLRWSVLSPQEYANRKVFHKLWVSDFDPSVLNTKGEQKAVAKRDKARKMLAAVDANAGGKLTAKPARPTDDDLALHLTNKPMIITVMVWDDRDGNPGGNWVCAVAPKSKGIDVKPPKAGGAKAKSSGGYGSSSGGAGRGRADDDDEIPF